MVTVISYDLFEQGDINSIMEMSNTEYVHISSKVRKLALINLGIENKELDKIKTISASFNLFSKDFNPKVLSSLDIDCCILTSGSLSNDEFNMVVNNIKPLIGKTQFVGIGIGKEILISATNNSDWSKKDNFIVNSKFNIACFDEASDEFVDYVK